MTIRGGASFSPLPGLLDGHLQGQAPGPSFHCHTPGPGTGETHQPRGDGKTRSCPGAVAVDFTGGGLRLPLLATFQKNLDVIQMNDCRQLKLGVRPFSRTTTCLQETGLAVTGNATFSSRLLEGVIPLSEATKPQGLAGWGILVGFSIQFNCNAQYKACTTPRVPLPNNHNWLWQNPTSRQQ